MLNVTFQTTRPGTVIHSSGDRNQNLKYAMHPVVSFQIALSDFIYILMPVLHRKFQKPATFQNRDFGTETI